MVGRRDSKFRRGFVQSLADRDERPERLLLIDDALSVARCWELHLEDTNIEIEVVTSFAEARKRLDPAVWCQRPCAYAIIDLWLGDGNGEDLLPLFPGLEPPAAVAVVSGHLERAVRLRIASKCAVAIDANLSRAEALELVACLRQHRALLLPVDAFAQRFGLTPQEKQVLQGYISDRSDAQIASTLGLAPATIASYWNRIRAKTQRSTRSGVVGTLASFLSEMSRFRGAPLLAPAADSRAQPAGRRAAGKSNRP